MTKGLSILLQRLTTPEHSCIVLHHTLLDNRKMPKAQAAARQNKHTGS
jgi:hypothetical protein